MSQVLLLGISGLDADLLRVYGPSLPNLRRLMLESPFLDLNSTIPPEPAPAWTSVYTGLNPANHGMLASMDCLERTIPETQTFKEELFWEKAARAGKRVCVLNPLLIAEQSLEGLMLVPSTPYPLEGEQTQLLAEAFPTLLDEPLIPPASQLTAFCNTLQERTEKQVTTALELLAREPWDLFFIQLDALDHVQHFLWRYSDPGDPMYPGKNAHANRILEFYQFFDKIVGRFRAAIQDSGWVLGVVSSHGHERRCIYRLHINEWLREEQFLTPLGQARPQPGTQRSSWLDLARLKSPGSWLAQHLPWGKGTTSKRHSIDQQHTVAHLVELASATSSYGGITINRELLEREQRSYDLVCEAIVTGLERLCLKENPIVNWVKKREQCYQGKHLEHYPDILFELRSDFGVGRSLNTPLIVPDSTHRLISGTHSSHGVFLLANWPAELDVYEDFSFPSVIDIAPTVLHLLNVEHSKLDGQALVQQYPVRQLI
ncbi:MAG TPA: alkaline phosphatase family protein [Ktedonobacteraceae bacterium]